MNNTALEQIGVLYDRLESLNETIECLKIEYKELLEIAEDLEDIVKN